MKSIPNAHVSAAAKVRSASIGVLGAVIHPLPVAGDYTGTVCQDGVEVLDLRVNVDARNPLGRADLDLSRRKTAFGTERRDWACSLRPGGYLVLYSSGGRGGFHVLLHKQGASERDETSFDSRSLGANDLFAVTLTRPGVYAVLEEVGKARAQIRVSAPGGDDSPQEPLAQVDVTVAAGKFDPAIIELKPAQPVVFAIGERASSISIQLDAADERLAPPAPQRTVTWPSSHPHRALSVLQAVM